jgi:hypothetical protein
VRIWEQLIEDTVESGGIFTFLCHPINLTVLSENWGDPVDEFLFPVIDMLAKARDLRKTWVCTCSQLADFHRRVSGVKPHERRGNRNDT